MTQAPPPGQHRLTIHGVEAGYGTTFILRDISFEAHGGDVVGLIGPNGSGKSTLLKAIAGVLPMRAGEVRIDGAPLRAVAERVAFVPQREDVNWDFPVTALDVVLMGRYRRCGWLRRPGSRDRRMAAEALDRLGLGGMGGRHISQFSGGQQQRIFLARAMVQEPLVVVLDEPFTGIDAENRAVFHETIRDFSRRGAIVLMATHDLDEVHATCSHVCCLNGRLIAYGPAAATFTPKNLRATFGGRVAVFA
ncbi:MAG: metal ABC transporter ATP-binding protein [Dehalococcoidia bacterium]